MGVHFRFFIFHLEWKIKMTVCTRTIVPCDAVIVGRCLSQLTPSHNGSYSMHGQSLVERV